MTTPAPSLADFERRLGVSLEGPEAERAQAALEDATTLVLAEVSPAVAARWSADGLPGPVRIVALKAARREFDNPEGYRSEGLGEHSAEVETATGVYLTEAERATVARAAYGRTGGFVGTVRTPSAYERPYR